MDHKITIISILIFSLISNIIPLNLAQINTPCSPSMFSTINGCMSFLTGNGNSPTSECCGALRSLTGTGLDCLCLIVTASVPLNLPINRTLAVSLPRACNMPRVPVQCKAAATPLPAPGPASTIPPTSSQIPQDRDRLVPEPSEARAPESMMMMPPESFTDNNNNNDNGADRTASFTPTPSSSSAATSFYSHSLNLFLLLLTLAFGIIINI